ncbi:hypothetical protein ACFQ7F_22135 [Streptomyces sp. NPDC056486]
MSTPTLAPKWRAWCARRLATGYTGTTVPRAALPPSGVPATGWIMEL